MTIKRVCVTGAASFVGSALVPVLINYGYEVNAFGLFLYAPHALPAHLAGHYRKVVGDLRNIDDVKRGLEDCDAVIHLACVANDDAWALDPAMGKAVNYDAFRPLVRAAKEQGVKRFIYASSSSVYGIKTEDEVTEDLPLEPLTDYSKFKGLCEDVLNEERRGSYGRLKAAGEAILGEESAPGFTTVSIRPGTLCGYAPGLRLDLIMNIFVAQAMVNNKITVWGGQQTRALLHVGDMVRCYMKLLEAPDAAVDRKVWNIAAVNMRALDIAKLVSERTGAPIEMQPLPLNDQRSYSISSKAIQRDLGFVPVFTIQDAIEDLVCAFRSGMVPNALIDPKYYRLRQMKKLIEQGALK